MVSIRRDGVNLALAEPVAKNLEHKLVLRLGKVDTADLMILLEHV